MRTSPSGVNIIPNNNSTRNKLLIRIQYLYQRNCILEEYNVYSTYSYQRAKWKPEDATSPSDSYALLRTESKISLTATPCLYGEKHKDNNLDECKVNHMWSTVLGGYTVAISNIFFRKKCKKCQRCSCIVGRRLWTKWKTQLSDVGSSQPIWHARIVSTIYFTSGLIIFHT